MSQFYRVVSIKMTHTIYIMTSFKYKSHKMTRFIKINDTVFSIFKYKNDTQYLYK